MTKAPNRLTSLLHRLGVAGPARVRFYRGTGAPFVILLALGVLLLAAAPALANSAHGPERAIGLGFGEGAGQLELVAPYREIDGPSGEFGQAHGNYYSIAGSGVAVNDEHHDVYVADTGNSRVDEFNEKGEFLLAFGANVGGPGSGTCMLVPGCKRGAVGVTSGELSAELPSPRFVAVDNAVGASNGDVYVGEGVGLPEQNEKQFVELSGATGGTFTLTFEGHTTNAIPFTTKHPQNTNIEPGDVKETIKALEAAMPGDPGAFFVYEVLSPEGEVVALEVEFVGPLKESVTGALSCDGAGLAPAGVKCEANVVHTGSKPVEEVIEKFSPAGALEEGWGTKGRLDVGEALLPPVGMPYGDGYLDGIAVDPSGNLWVEVGRRVYRFGETGHEIATPTKVYHEESAAGIAVNAAGELYAEYEAIYKFQEHGGVFQPVGPVSAAHDPGPTGFALNTAGDTVYLGLGNALEQGIPAEVFGAPELQGSAGVAVDSSTGEPPFSGAVYAANTVADEVDIDTLRLEADTQPASQVKATSITLNGTIDPEGTPVEECVFEYGASEISGEYEHSVPCEQGLGEGPGEIGTGTSPVPVSAKLSGLRGGTVYHFRVVARKGTTIVPGEDMEQRMPATPVPSGEEATEVTASSAQLHALVDPEGWPVTRCRFEYGTSTAYGMAVPCEQRLAQIGTGTEPVPVSVQLAGLSPNVTYHWRLSLRNEPVKGEPGEVYGPDHTFVYPASGSGASALPDNRSYEMVTPPFKNGASIGTTFFGLKYNISEGEGGESLDPESSERVIAQSIQCLPGSTSCDAKRGDDQAEGEPFAFTRTPAGWVSTPLSPPSTSYSENLAWVLGANEGDALFSMPTPPGGEDDWYLRSPAGSFTDIGPLSPPSAGATVLEHTDPEEQPVTTADLSHVVWESSDQWPFAEEVDPAGDGEHWQALEYAGACGSREQAECAAAKPFPVGVNEEGKPFSGCETFVGYGTEPSLSDWNAVSADGRTVYFTALCSGENQLYARIDGEEPVVEGVRRKAETVAISAPQCGAGSASGEVECREAPASDAVFAGASTDGSRAFFLDTHKLTDEASEGAGVAEGNSDCTEQQNECNLYLYNFAEPALHNLVDVSAAENAAPGLGVGGPQVRGVVAISADGSHVYFVANGALTGAANGQGQKAIAGHCHDEVGSCNLYVYERDARYPNGHLAFIARVPARDYRNWYGAGEYHANVTPDGRFLVFASHGLLTSDDTRSGNAAQIFRYDAASEQLTRVSIGADGYNNDGNAGRGDASIVIPDGPFSSGQAGPARGDPTMSNNGDYVFFQSPIALTPNALNDVVIGYAIEEYPRGSGKSAEDPNLPTYAENVYEWAADGAGGCRSAAGCTYLISDGRDTSIDPHGPCARDRMFSGGEHSVTPENFVSAVCLLGTDGEGKNVFFTTADRLVSQDTDTQLDIYDARVCEQDSPCIAEPPPPLPPCGGEQCHGIPAATPSLLAPGTASFNGEGNITPLAPAKPAVKKKTAKCKKVVVRKKGMKKTECIQPKKSKKARKSASKSSKNRRTGR